MFGKETEKGDTRMPDQCSECGGALTSGHPEKTLHKCPEIGHDVLGESPEVCREPIKKSEPDKLCGKTTQAYQRRRKCLKTGKWISIETLEACG